MFGRIRTGQPDLPPDASPGLRRVLSHMLEKDARRRATMAELMTDPWVTDGGRFPMPTNFALVTVDAADIASAVCTRLGPAITILEAKDRLRRLVGERPAAGGGEPAAGAAGARPSSAVAAIRAMHRMMQLIQRGGAGGGDGGGGTGTDEAVSAGP
jgi:hypothetical protein